MTASTTIGYATSEVRATRTIRVGDEPRTIRVRPGRGNSRRAAINASRYGSDR